jgi:Tat protein secretion system quality control protein TatD with DNase activity
MLIVGGYLEESKNAFDIASKSDNFRCTVGVHPCRVDEIDKSGLGEKVYFEKLG